MSVADCVAGNPTAKSTLSRLKTLIESVPDGNEPFNSTWPGFRGLETLGIGLYLSDAVGEVLDQLEGGTADEQIECFKGVIEEMADRSIAYFCRGVVASSGACAWIGFEQNDAAEVLVAGIFQSPLAFEEHLRAQGVIFPYNDEVPPSGHNDVFTDDQILHLIRAARSKAPR